MLRLSVQICPTQLQKRAMLLEILLQMLPALCSSYITEGLMQVELCTSQN